jgi:Outer membrane efflux protein
LNNIYFNNSVAVYALAICAITESFYGYNTSRQQVDAAQSTLQAAQTVADAAKVRFDNGLGTTLDVLQAQQELTTALLRRTKFEKWQVLNQTAQASEAELRNAVADYLQRMAASAENGRPMPRDNLESAFAKWNLTASGIVENDHPRLVRRLIN